MRLRWSGRLLALMAIPAAIVVAQNAATGPRMAAAARAFLAALSPELRAQATFPFDAEERYNWHYIPRERKGVPFKAMNTEQRRAAEALLRAALSDPGNQKVTTIMSLETILHELENRNPIRDPDLYYFSIFGEPKEDGTWGWRVEGHHLSLNFTVVKGVVQSSTPQFLGANPAEVRAGPRQGLRALKEEEDLARQLVQSLTEEQRKQAIIAETAPRDIVTAAQRKVNPLQPTGIAVTQLTEAQRGLLRDLVRVYLAVMPDDVARARVERMRAAGFDRITFAWAGGLEKGQPHYYRIQGPTFLIEYDNTQNNANHIHSVWRDFNGDFGEDVLRAHYETAPPGHGHSSRPAHVHQHGGAPHAH